MIGTLPIGFDFSISYGSQALTGIIPDAEPGLSITECDKKKEKSELQHCFIILTYIKEVLIT